jgi:hypothetical protein
MACRELLHELHAHHDQKHEQADQHTDYFPFHFFRLKFKVPLSIYNFLAFFLMLKKEPASRR